MSAETTTELTGAALLREAARQMRERAEAATPGPWWNESGTVHAPYPFGRDLASGPGGACHPLNAQGQNGRDADADGEHAASWHPAVALAGAKLLETMAAMLDRYPDLATDADAAAESLARAYLGLS